MGDSTDPSSGAARGAPQDNIKMSPGRDNLPNTAEVPARSGLLQRLWGTIRTPSEPLTASPVIGLPTAGGLTHGMVNLRRMRVEDVAIPRAEIMAVPVDITLPELVHVFQDSGLTRLPVFSRTLDTPLGLVHLKDLALRYGFNGKPARFALKGMMRPLLFAPPSMPIGVLMQKMQSERMHMALVIDEYGGVDGLVTIEDLIEQVVGEIEDEHDEPEDALWTREKPGCYLVQSRAPLDELSAEIGLDLLPHMEADDLEEIDTLGGLVFLLAGRVPARGEVIPHDSGAQFEIVDADPRRIKRIRVRMDGITAAAAE